MVTNETVETVEAQAAGSSSQQATTLSLTSLLSQFRAPTQSDFMRKRKIRTNEPPHCSGNKNFMSIVLLRKNWIHPKRFPPVHIFQNNWTSRYRMITRARLGLGLGLGLDRTLPTSLVHLHVFALGGELIFQGSPNISRLT